MKKNLLLFIALFSLFGASAWAQTFTQGDLKFTVIDADAKTVSVAKANNDITGEIVLPSTVSNDGVAYTVTEVAASGFYGTTITGITIPASVVRLNNRVFEGCHQLTNIVINDSEEELYMVTGYYSIFYGVNSDKTIYVGRNLVTSENSCPFYSNVTSVVFGDKVTTIRRNLFSDQYKLSNVTIGKGVKTIEQYAFSSCGKDESVGEMVVMMGENVTLIENDAFNSCSKLTSITLPSTLKNINGYAFASTGLTSITIPASVDSIGNRGFGDCHSMASINIEASDNVLKMINGYNGSFNYADADKNVVIGRNLWLSENGAPFINPTSVEFGEKVTTINPYLFRWCDKLSSVSIGSGVVTIGEAAFYDAGDADDIGEMVVAMGENVTSIGADAFNGCDKLTSITLPSTLKVINGYAFAGTGLTGITIPASVDSIGERGFGSCGSLTSVYLEDSAEPLKLRNGYYGTFAYSEASKTIYIGRDLWRNDNSSLFTNATSVVFGDQVTTINPYLFNGADNLSSVTIGKGVQTIGDHAFYEAGDADEIGEMVVTMGENVTTIGGSAFDGCDKLSSITLPEKLDTIFSYAFASSGLTSLRIPVSVDSIGEGAFRSCGSLANIRIEDSSKPLSVYNGYYGAFAYEGAEKTVYIGRDLKLTDTNCLFYAYSGETTSVEFGDMVTTINPNLFNDASKLSSLVIGNGVKTIGERAFYDAADADDLGEMVVTMGENVETIGNNAFDLCEKLMSITLPSTLKLINGYAFSSSGLTGISIPASVDSIGEGAFRSCGSLANIRIEDSSKPLSVYNGYYGAFSYEGAEKTVYIGRDLKLTDTNCLFYANSGETTSVEFGDMVTTINPNMFNDASKLSKLVIGNGVKTIGDYAFYDAGDDESVGELVVTMGNSVETIGKQAFDLCEKMTSITLPSTLTTIGETAFATTGLTSISIPASVTSIGQQGFGWTALQDITFEDGDEPLAIDRGYYGTFRDQKADYTLYLGRNLVYGDTGGTPFPNATAVTIGPKVTAINPNGLNTKKLLTVKAPWIEPIAIVDNVFNGTTYSIGTLWLPGGTKQAYAEADGWKNFMNVEFASYVVSVEATQGGSLTVGDITVANGEKAQTLIDRQSDVTFQATPADNYDFTSITVNGEAVETEGNAYTYYTLLQDIDVKATFTEKPKFDITATATGGTVSLNGATPSASQTVKVYRDTDVTLAIAAAEGYENPKVTVNGTDVTAQLKDNQLTIENIQEAQTIVVTFAKKKFQITTEATQNGTIQLSKNVVEWGDSFTATFKPATGYELATATVNGQDMTASVVNNVLTVTDVKEAKTVGATFKKLTFTVAKESTQNGTIELSKTTVEWGDSFTATYKPATGYELATATVNGQDMTASVVNNVLTVNNVQENTVVGGTFQKQTYTVSISGGGITVSTTTPKYGDNVTVTIDDDPDRTLVSLIVNGVDVTAQVVNGQYTIKNVTGNVTIEATFKSTKEFITMTGDYATFSCPQDLNFTGSDLRAYIASGFNKNTNQVLLVRVYDVPAGTGIFLVGKPGTTYKVPYSETSSYYVNLFKANLQKSAIYGTTGDYTNYTFGEQDGDPGFYPIVDYTTLLAQTAYLQLPSSFVAAGVKVSVVFEDDIIDGIEDFRISDEDATIYDIAGRRLGKTQKGINIVNGKKILK